MTPAEAYPCGRDYEERSAHSYTVGDIVAVGPAYRMGDRYSPDGFEGIYRVEHVDGPWLLLEGSGREGLSMCASRVVPDGMEAPFGAVK